MERSTMRWPALDGLRGLAILLVFAFHLPLDVFRTGSFGVIIFFVLSGFLITTILLRELDSTGRIGLRWFYGRRAARLLPALGILVLGHLIIQIILGDADRWWERTWPVLLYLSNVVVLEGVDLGLVGHTWSLAIEEHFYLLWPLALLAIPNRWRFSAGWGIATLASSWRLALLSAGEDNVRVFFASDTNAFAPLVGCAIAISVHEKRLNRLSRRACGMAVAALVILSTLPWQFTDRRLLYLALPVALLSAVAIWASLETPIPWLEHPILRWIGRISYGLYLWHFVLTSLPWDRWSVPAVPSMIFGSFVLATVSFYLVEQPFLLRWRGYEAGRRRAAPATNPRDAGNLKPQPGKAT
jgi:peptidoglycan/LPS O-acetylase OafA/YrhL